MKTFFYFLFLLFLPVCAFNSYAQLQYPVLPGQKSIPGSNQLSPQYMPVMGVWVWNEDILSPDGYKVIIEQAGAHSPYNILIPFLRFPDKEVTDEIVYRQVKSAAMYAAEHNIALVPDLDVRSARRTFRALYPDELQQMLRLKEIPLSLHKPVDIIVNSIDNLYDHYAGGKIPPYNALSNQLLRVYSYKTNSAGIIPVSIMDITSACKATIISEDSIKISLPGAVDENTFACAMVSFTLFYPDVFSPNLKAFQQRILKQYADVPVAGVCKDEWGFPPYFPRFYQEGIHDFWYSAHMAKQYALKTGGRELLADCFLMTHAIPAREMERQVAVNFFMEIIRQRNVELENDFYHCVKEVYGEHAVVTVHPTWWPYPDYNEFKKNGLDWWAAKRDWAQTDEIVPFAVRTALCKKWNSPLWYNMYYTMNLPVQVWSSALAGGRINYLGFQSIYDSEVMRAETRIRLLNYISNSPVDCRVAVIFGHAAAGNWAGAYHNDVGMKLADTLWFNGYRTDLIPTSEIENGSLQINEEGWVCYGEQRYNLIVLYHPEYEKQVTGDFFAKAVKGNTALLQVGEWTHYFDGTPVNQSNTSAYIETVNDYRQATPRVFQILEDQHVQKQTPATDTLDSRYFRLRGFNTISYFPPTTGFSRLIDGTVILVAGTRAVSGDTMKTKFMIDEHPVYIDAIGIAGVRIDKSGKLQALAASSLKRFSTANFSVELDERCDIALWIDDKEGYSGVIQGLTGEIPEALLSITKKWTLLGLPEIISEMEFKTD